ncbi:hypothetical protein Biyabedamokiny2_00117 [Staphylococcus phage Biyabeda-mokiny_2]|nr:hypothetical protein Biyabedamokiny2_00117 [Staphylococcus phage Biyabeda-mokiny_2]
MIFKNNKVEKDINFIRICDVSRSSTIVQQIDTVYSKEESYE